jgi:hypothetical protein
LFLFDLLHLFGRFYLWDPLNLYGLSHLYGLLIP